MKKIFWWSILGGVFILGFLVSYLALTFSKVFIKTGGSFSPSASFSNATPLPVNSVVPEKGVYNFLLLGFGGLGHSGALLTDSIITIHVNTNTRKILLITIPRDLWVPGNHKINAAGIQVGFQNTGTELQNVTGLPINYYVAIDFNNFVKLIDNLGGVNVDVPKTYDDAFYPIAGLENETCGFTEEQINTFKTQFTGFNLEKQFTCRYEHMHFDKGPLNLDGSTALKFVRSRHGDSDFGRSLRQLAVLTGIENKLISLRSVGKLESTIDTLLKIVKTDLSAGIIKTLIDVFGNPGLYQINQIQLTTENVLNEGKSSDGQYILFPKVGNFNFSEIKNYIGSSLK